MTLPKSFAPVRQQCRHYPDFCPRNAVEGGDLCELHQPRLVAATPHDPDLARTAALEPPSLDDCDDDLVSHFLPAAHRRRLVRPPPEPRQMLLPFESRGGGNVLCASPQRPFKPRGLMLWGAGSLGVEATYVGNSEQLLCSWGRVPAAWWSTQASFEEVCKALADGKEAASWGTWDMVVPGVQVRLQFDGNAGGVCALMWGLSV